MILTQVIITANLTFVGSTADFIKILEQSKFPIGLCWNAHACTLNCPRVINMVLLLHLAYTGTTSGTMCGQVVQII